MPTPRRSRERRKKPRGVSDFIRGELVMLENFARVLNGPPWLHLADQLKVVDGKLTREYDAPPEEVAEHQRAVEQAAAVVAASLGAAYPHVPDSAAHRFDELAEGQAVEYALRKLFRRGHALSLDYRTRLTVVSRSWRGIMAVWVAHYFMHPYRERLRRCQQCARWFVDLTRNKSARRCSKACTVAWSNKQRTKGGQ